VATWHEFELASPDLAAFGYRRLLGRVAYLATLRADGAPRLHPLVAHIGQGRLFIYMDPASPKVHDLQSDARYALHCSVEDADGGQGEFSLRGRADLIDDPTLRARLFESARADGSNPQDRYVIFELSIEAAASTIYNGDRLVRDRWQAA
jgi:hypothetical protein